MPRRAKGNEYQGMNWIRKEKRLAIYLRDGLACVYCGDSVERGAKLTLDHLRCYRSGGSTNATNLVTCCFRCNASRGKRSWRIFADVVAAYLNHGIKGVDIVQHIEVTRNRPLDLQAAKDLIARRGGFTAALYGEAA